MRSGFLPSLLPHVLKRLSSPDPLHETVNLHYCFIQTILTIAAANSICFDIYNCAGMSINPGKESQSFM
jgi:hypothetical protein